MLVCDLLVVFLCILVWTCIKDITILIFIYLISSALLFRFRENMYGRYMAHYNLLMGYLDALQKYLGTHLYRFRSYLFDTETSASWRMILLGKTGSGKSSAGNTILGKDTAFHEEASFGSVTEECKRVSGEKFGRNLHVVDTPGLYDTRRTFVENGRELFKGLSLTKPGPHVFILVVKIGGFSDEDFAAYKHFKTILKDEIFTTGILLFTHGDEIPATSSLQTFINDTAAQNENFKNLCNEFGNRRIVLNNKNRADEQQVKNLLDMIKEITDSGKIFTNSKSFELKLEILNDIEKDTSLDFSAQMEAYTERLDKAKLQQAKDVIKGIGIGVGAAVGLSLFMKNAPQRFGLAIAAVGAPYVFTRFKEYISKPKPKPKQD